MSKTAISYALTGRHALLQTFRIIANTLISPMKNRLGLAHSDGYCELSCKRVNAKIEAGVSPGGACCRVSRLQKRIEMSLLLDSGSRTGHLTGPRTLPLLTRNRKCSCTCGKSRSNFTILEKWNDLERKQDDHFHFIIGFVRSWPQSGRIAFKYVTILEHLQVKLI